MMRKRLIGPTTAPEPSAEDDWLDLERLASVELTSEDPYHPIEAALIPGLGQGGWRAQQPGEQTIRLLFDEPQAIRRIRLMFQEDATERTQEFVLRWSDNDGRTYHEIVRQQYNFSPQGTADELEAYEVSLDGLTVLELGVIPDIGRDDLLASLRELRLA